RSSELFSIEDILARLMPAELGGTHRAPSNTVAGETEAAEGTRQTLRMGEQTVLAHNCSVEHDLAGDGGAQGKLALDLGSLEPSGPSLDDKATDHAVELRPNDRDIGDRRVRDP